MSFMREMLQKKFGDPLTLGLPEVAEVLGVSRNGSYRLAAEGEIPIIQIGKKKRVSIDWWARKLEEGE